VDTLGGMEQQHPIAAVNRVHGWSGWGGLAHPFLNGRTTLLGSLMQTRIRITIVEPVSIGVKLSVGKSVACPEKALMST